MPEIVPPPQPPPKPPLKLVMMIIFAICVIACSGIAAISTPFLIGALQRILYHFGHR